MGQEVLLQMTDICKEFPGVKALDHVSLTVKKGTVHALMGENGAGKSTLMKCLFGIYSKDAGKIELEGKEVNFKNSREALNNGVAMVHQELNQALKRNVMDNIWLGRYPMTAGIMVNEHKMLEDTNKIFEELGIAVDPKRIMSTMPVSQRQMVEIAKAVSYNSKIIVFDEPTSSLTEEEVEHLFKIINMLRDRGCGIIYISHKMAEILRIADEVTVMRDGTWIATEPAQNLTTDKIIKLMVGRELTNQFPPKTNKPGEVALEVEHLSARYSLLQDVSFKARKGEIVGLAGLDGSGRTETLENIFGVATRKDGVIKLDGKEVRNRNARESIKNGFALLTEERRATGIFGILLCLNNPVAYILMFAIAFGVAFVLTWMIGYKDEVQETAEKNIETEKTESAPAETVEEKTETANAGAQTLYSPLEGTAIPLSEVKDATFASEVLGKGMAVIPSKGEVKAPCDATVSTIFDTKHAIGLATESGLELLIHIGVDTVELGGKFYTAHVKDGDEVKKGQTLITFDMDAIKAAGYDVTTPLIVTNTDDYEEVKMLAEGTVNNGSEVLEVK